MGGWGHDGLGGGGVGGDGKGGMGGMGGGCGGGGLGCGGGGAAGVRLGQESSGWTTLAPSDSASTWNATRRTWLSAGLGHNLNLASPLLCSAGPEIKFAPVTYEIASRVLIGQRASSSTPPCQSRRLN